MIYLSDLHNNTLFKEIKCNTSFGDKGNEKMYEKANGVLRRAYKTRSSSRALGWAAQEGLFKHFPEGTTGQEMPSSGDEGEHGH